MRIVQILRKALSENRSGQGFRVPGPTVFVDLDKPCTNFHTPGMHGLHFSLMAACALPQCDRRAVASTPFSRSISLWTSSSDVSQTRVGSFRAPSEELWATTKSGSPCTPSNCRRRRYSLRVGRSCAANSRKLSGGCVAGIEVVGHDSANWKHPVSSRPNHEVSESSYSATRTPRNA